MVQRQHWVKPKQPVTDYLVSQQQKLYYRNQLQPSKVHRNRPCTHMIFGSVLKMFFSCVCSYSIHNVEIISLVCWSCTTAVLPACLWSQWTSKKCFSFVLPLDRWSDKHCKKKKKITMETRALCLCNNLECLDQLYFAHCTFCKPADCRPWCSIHLLQLHNNPRWPLRDAP